jgi:DNA-binding NarL/FixJ family response regulator
VIGVLIVDDHPLVRAGLDSLLSTAEDIEVLGVASDGADVVDLVESLRPAVVLMDLSMPGVDGIEATRAIRAQHPDVPVVILTTFSDRERILAALDAGAIGYLLKDAEPDELVRAVRAAAAGDAPLAPRAARELIATTRPTGDPLERLSPREREVLDLIGEGLPNKLIARRLGIAEKTVKSHLTRVYECIGVSDRTAAALWARENTGS